MEVQGKFGTAIVYTDDIEEMAISQITTLLDQPMAENAHVRIMPDVHAGAGCVIGYTAKLTGKVVPNLIGVDIGCGVTAWNLGLRAEIGDNFEKLDAIIRGYIPSGREVRKSVNWTLLEKLYNTLNRNEFNFDEFKENVKVICNKTSQKIGRVWKSIGSLGGGNHFIEIDRDNNDELWLVIHSGSRNFGLKIATFHQNIAKHTNYASGERSFSSEEIDIKIQEIRRTKQGKEIEIAIGQLKSQAGQQQSPTGLEYLQGKEADEYYHDMNIAQIYAQLNRRMMAFEILSNCYNIEFFPPVESVHNYINFSDNIMRKGAISAHEGEHVIIPLNMAEGIIYGIGKGKDEWNFSAPHGAGRKMSRTKARSTLSLSEFQMIMDENNVWTSCVGRATLDEAPQAYKDASKIIEYLSDTVDIKVQMKPVYNFKAAE